MKRRQKSYIVELDPSGFGFKDAMTIHDNIPKDRRLLRDLEREAGLNRKELDQTGISQIVEVDGVLTIRRIKAA